MLTQVFNFILDFVFPRSAESEKLRSLSHEQFEQSVGKAEPLPFSFVTALFSYKDPLAKELILSIKNRKDTHSVELASHFLYKRVREIAPHATLIPIPISRHRRNERGYNQCELLIEGILKLDTEKQLSNDFNLLSRAKDRGEQKTKNRKERLESTSHIFTVNSAASDAHIVIIDDVSTTGSTLKEARDALLLAGFKNVTAVALAH